MTFCKIPFFLLALCIWCGECEVIYKGVGDEAVMKCEVDSKSDIDWTFNGDLILGIKGKSGTKRMGSSHITAKARSYGDTLKVPRLETRDAGVYSCKQSGKQYTLHVVSVFAKPGPVLVQSSDAELHCDVTGDPNTEVLWLRLPNGEKYSEKYNEKNRVIHLKSVTSNEAGQWTCLVKDLKLSVTLTVVVGLQTTAVNVSNGDDIELPCSLPQGLSQHVVGGKWKADHLPTVSFPSLKNTKDKGLHWNGEKSSKVNFTTGQLSTNFDVTLKNVQSSDAGTFVCTVEFEGGVSLSVETTLTVVSNPSGGGAPYNPQSEITKIVAEILGMAIPSICGIAPDRALLKLKELKRCVDDAGASPSDTSCNVSSQDISPCPPDEPAPLQDTGFAQSITPEDDIKSLERKKLNLQIKLLEIQNEYYTLNLKILMNSQ